MKNTNQINKTDINISFTIEPVNFHVLNIIYGNVEKTVPVHSHGKGCYELHYIPRGHGTAIINETQYLLSPGTLYVTGPHTEHGHMPDTADPLWEYCIYFYTSFINEFRKTDTKSIPFLFLKNSFWFGCDSQNIKASMEELFLEYDQKQTGCQIQIEAILKQIIVKMVRNYEKNSILNQSPLPFSTLDYNSFLIEKYFLYEYADASLGELSDRLGLSVRQTQRLLAKQYGKTFIQKKVEARMSMASTLLNQTALSVSAISENLGFATAEHFSSSFHKYYGISAREYRHQHQGIQASAPGSTGISAREYRHQSTL